MSLYKQLPTHTIVKVPLRRVLPETGSGFRKRESERPSLSERRTFLSLSVYCCKKKDTSTRRRSFVRSFVRLFVRRPPQKTSVSFNISLLRGFVPTKKKERKSPPSLIHISPIRYLQNGMRTDYLNLIAKTDDFCTANYSGFPQEEHRIRIPFEQCALNKSRLILASSPSSSVPS